ncbi:MAG: hypothetical protein AAF569_04520 [Pseudomonadota bacterium]
MFLNRTVHDAFLAPGHEIGVVYIKPLDAFFEATEVKPGQVFFGRGKIGDGPIIRVIDTKEGTVKPRAPWGGEMPNASINDWSDMIAQFKISASEIENAHEIREKELGLRKRRQKPHISRRRKGPAPGAAAIAAE